MRLCLSFAVLTFLTFTAGCGEQDSGIKTYRVAKPADVKPPEGKAAEQGSGPYRILGAMFPADDPLWFFKVAGKADELTAVEKEFDAFLTTVRFPNGAKNPPLYDLPGGWTEGPPRQMRHATLLFGPAGKFELSVSQAAGGVDQNVKRWADQVGSEFDKAKATREVVGKDGAKGLRVDVTGPNNPAGAMGGPFLGKR